MNCKKETPHIYEEDLACLVGDGTSNPDFCLRLYEYSDYEPPEGEETTEYVSTINALDFYGELPAE